VITLQFVRGTALDSKLIEWFGGGSRFSHVDIVLPDGMLLGSRSDVVGGASAGVQIRNPDYVGTQTVLRISLPQTTVLEEHFYRWARSQIGKGYDKTAIIGFVVGRSWQDPDSWFCSEYIAEDLVQVRYFPTAPTSPTNRITPDALLLLLSMFQEITLP
jgi:hypothetical protein